MSWIVFEIVYYLKSFWVLYKHLKSQKCKKNFGLKDLLFFLLVITTNGKRKMIKIHSGATFIRIFVMKLLWKKFFNKRFSIFANNLSSRRYSFSLFSFTWFFFLLHCGKIVFSILLFIHFPKKLVYLYHCSKESYFYDVQTCGKG